MIRTEIPFGYAIIALFFLMAFTGGFFLSLILFIVSFINKSKAMRWFSVVPVGAIGGFIAVIITINALGEPEWNPEIKGDSEIEGVWSKGGVTLELSPEHHFTYRSSNAVVVGEWSRDDWNLNLKPATDLPSGASPKTRFIQFWGKYRVLTKELGDPDGWDGDYGLTKN